MVTFCIRTPSLGTAALLAPPRLRWVCRTGHKARGNCYFLVPPISENPSAFDEQTHAGDVDSTGSTSGALVASPDFIVSDDCGAVLT